MNISAVTEECTMDDKRRPSGVAAAGPAVQKVGIPQHARGKFKRAHTMVGIRSMTAEADRLKEDKLRDKNWKRWGPYLSERQWATVREDYSADGSWYDRTNNGTTCTCVIGYHPVWVKCKICICWGTCMAYSNHLYVTK